MQQRSLLSSAEPATHISPAVLGKGFRPFFLLAAAFTVVALPVWLASLVGWVNPGAYLGAQSWHAHEMVFGFTIAVIAGFLLTAVGNWTKRETAVGPWLLLLCALWLGGRVGVVFGDRLPRYLPLVLDSLFLPALAVALARPIIATKNQRNYGFLVILTAFASVNLAVHLTATGVIAGWLRRGHWVAVDLIIVVIAVIAGRVIPMFTKNATRAEGIRSQPWLDRLAIASIALLLVADAVLAEAALVALAAGAAAVLSAGRMVRWGGQHTLRHPLLWVLHIGYAWIAVGLGLRALATLSPQTVSESTALHALTAGGIGMMTIGMMTRVGLGHTGRMLAVPRQIAVAFGLVFLAALIRVVGPLAGSKAYLYSMLAAGVLWVVGFGLYLVTYLPALLSPRVDGRPG